MAAEPDLEAADCADTAEPDLEAAECALCIEPMAEADICRTACGHAFHLTCIMQALRKTPQPVACPLCRAPLEPPAPPRIPGVIAVAIESPRPARSDPTPRQSEQMCGPMDCVGIMVFLTVIGFMAWASEKG